MSYKNNLLIFLSNLSSAVYTVYWIIFGSMFFGICSFPDNIWFALIPLLIRKICSFLEPIVKKIGHRNIVINCSHIFCILGWLCICIFSIYLSALSSSIGLCIMLFFGQLSSGLSNISSKIYEQNRRSSSVKCLGSLIGTIIPIGLNWVLKHNMKPKMAENSEDERIRHDIVYYGTIIVFIFILLVKAFEFFLNYKLKETNNNGSNTHKQVLNPLAHRID